MTKNKKKQKADVEQFETLFAHSKKIKLLSSITYLLEWDQETYMPKEGAHARADQLELMASLIHKEITGKTYKNALEKLIDLENGKIKNAELNLLQKASLKHWRRDYNLAAKLPNSFVKAFAKLTSESLIAWQKARKESDFSLFAPFLEKIVLMTRQKAEFLGYKGTPYNALLDFFEPDAKAQEISALFDDLKKSISSLLKKIRAAKQVEDAFLYGNFPKERQLAFSEHLLNAIGYDLNRGRLDLSAHPFSMSLHPHDSRITTRIHKDTFLDCITSVLHEAGHGLYEMGLQAEYYGSPICEAISLGIHESQSRFWETRIGLSKPFWKHFLPLLKEHFKEKLEKVTLDKFYKGINRVEPSLIRVESDEVTYSLHIILRFEVEKMLIEGKLEVSDLPAFWNEKMKELLGVTPKNDSEGCLQDIHWSMGSFGYFPTYTLGNIYASFFFEAFAKEFPDWEERVSQGEFLFIRDWLKDKVHRHGRSISAKDLAKKIGGSALSTAPYINYLNKKYGEIYGFSKK